MHMENWKNRNFHEKLIWTHESDAKSDADFESGLRIDGNRAQKQKKQVFLTNRFFQKTFYFAIKEFSFSQKVARNCPLGFFIFLASKIL